MAAILLLLECYWNDTGNEEMKINRKELERKIYEWKEMNCV